MTAMTTRSSISVKAPRPKPKVWGETAPQVRLGFTKGNLGFLIYDCNFINPFGSQQCGPIKRKETT